MDHIEHAQAYKEHTINSGIRFYKQIYNKPRGGGGGGHFNFICTEVCGHRIGKLTHPQTKAGPKTDPFSNYLQ